MVSCGATKTRLFGELSAVNPFAPHTQNNDMNGNNESDVPGSRMARDLRVTRAATRMRERAAVAADPDGVVSEAVREQADTVDIDIDIDGIPQVFSCETCKREFRTKCGLGVHVVRAHQLRVNNAIDVERVKARWSAEEVCLMARAEAAATVTGGTVFMNQHLVEKFPQSSLEAIKGKRRQEAYRAMVRDFCQEIQSQQQIEIDDGTEAGSAMIIVETVPTSIETTDRDPSAHRSAPELSSQRLLDYINQLVEQSSAIQSYQADILANIARDALLDGVVNVPAIKRWLGGIFPPSAVRLPQRD